jgi:chromosome segregation ATPase
MLDVGTLLLSIVALVAGSGAGWTLQQKLAGRREAELKRSVFESKGAIPQLEGAVRSRDQRLANQQTEIDKLKARVSNLDASIAEKTQELLKRDRELRRMASELAIATDGAPDDGVPLVEGVTEDPMAKPAATPGTAADVARLKKLEARYEALKRGLISRDDRIAELEAALQQAQAKSPTLTLKAELDEKSRSADSLTATLATREEQIKSLEARLASEVEQREVLETLAKGRAAGNRELKEQVAKLEQQYQTSGEVIKARNAIIGERELELRARNEELARSRQDCADRDRRILDLEREIERKTQAFAAQDARMQSLQATATVHTQRIEQLTQELAAARAATTRTEEVLKTRETELATSAAKVAAAATRLREHDGVVTTLKGALRDRDARIEALEQELARAVTEREAARATLAAAQETARTDDHEHAAQLATVRAERLSQQNEQLELLLAARERRIAELEQENSRANARVEARESSGDGERQVLETQLANARERCQRVEDELLAVAQEAKALRGRIATLEAEAEARASAEADIPLLSAVAAPPETAAHPQ